MRRRTLAGTAAALAIGTVAAPKAEAQTLASRVDGAQGAVHFSFPARSGVCGTGRNYSVITPTSSTTIGVPGRFEPCQAGPVRIVLDRAGRDIVGIQTLVGGETPTGGISDLGRVTGQQAAEYLLSLATRGEGRVGRDALSAALLADSASISDGVSAIARNKTLSRETRAGALSALGRAPDRLEPIPQRVIDALLSVARDEGDNLTLRRQAMTTLGRLDRGAGLPTVIELARDGGNPWLALEALNVLASSEDPRARAYLRTLAQRDDASEEAVAAAIRGLSRYATRDDAALLRGLYARLRSDRTRDAVVTAAADIGGAENVAWLMTLARNESEVAARRRRAIDNAQRAGVPTADLVKLYDTVGDQQMKDALVNVYHRIGDRAAIDKLIAIARTETNLTVRKRTISLLGTIDDQKVREALRELVGR